MTQKNIASLIDHTLLKPEATAEQIRNLCNEARQFRFASVPAATACCPGSMSMPRCASLRPCGFRSLLAAASPPSRILKRSARSSVRASWAPSPAARYMRGRSISSLPKPAPTNWATSWETEPTTSAMLAKRIIPCLDVNAGRVVKGVNFVELRDAGDPVEVARRYDEQGADEITFLDITASSDARDTILHVVEQVAEQVFIPLTVGGGVRSVEDVRRR